MDRQTGGGLWQEPLPWDFTAKVRDFLRPEVRLLDLNAGDGGYLLSLGHPLALTGGVVWQGEDYRRCLKRLGPRGAAVRFCENAARLPFGDGCFDVAINRQGPCPPEEIARVLARGGFLVTEQVGGMDARRPGAPDYNLENQGPKFRAAGFRVISGNQAYPLLEEGSWRRGHRFLVVAKRR